jgi:hypothetical protein
MRTTTIAAVFLIAAPAVAQEQQAGNAASRNADETFQSLIAQCDDTDALVMRSRIRLLLGRTTEEAAEQARQLLDEGFAACGEGDMDTAMERLEDSLAVADAGTDEVFGAGDEAEVAAAEDTKDGGAGEEVSGDRPWWKFW